MRRRVSANLALPFPPPPTVPYPYVRVSARKFVGTVLAHIPVKRQEREILLRLNNVYVVICFMRGFIWLGIRSSLALAFDEWDFKTSP